MGDIKALIGQVLNDTYRVESVIGEGAMGVVYEASHLRLDRRFAIKVLLPGIAPNPTTLSRFQREARVTSALGHPHIVDVTDFNHTPDGRPYIVMELLSGEDLGARMARQSQLELLEAVSILRQTASGLNAAHKSNVIHRDLKPQNIFLCRRGERDNFVKVLDFGISKVLASSSILTGSSALIGTPYYMAPEQAEQRMADVGIHTDVYSMGVILFEMLAGEPPFHAETIPGLLYLIVNKDPPPLRDLRPDIPTAAQVVIEKALRKQPEQRHLSMEALWRTLAFALDLGQDDLDEPTEDRQTRWTQPAPLVAGPTVPDTTAPEAEALVDETPLPGPASRFIEAETRPYVRPGELAPSLPEELDDDERETLLHMVAATGLPDDSEPTAWPPARSPSPEPGDGPSAGPRPRATDPGTDSVPLATLCRDAAQEQLPPTATDEREKAPTSPWLDTPVIVPRPPVPSSWDGVVRHLRRKWLLNLALAVFVVGGIVGIAIGLLETTTAPVAPPAASHPQPFTSTPPAMRERDLYRPVASPTSSAGQALTRRRRLWLTSVPTGAEVYLDAKWSGLTPLKGVSIDTYRQVLRVSKPGFESWRQTLEPGTENLVLKALLRPVPAGSAKAPGPIAASPPAPRERPDQGPGATPVSKKKTVDPFADEQRGGKGAVDPDALLAAGTDNDGSDRAPEDPDTLLAAGKGRKQPAGPPASGCGLRVFTLSDQLPTWAQVYLDGKLLGKSPLLLDGLAAGSHVIEVRREGYRPKRGLIQLSPGKTTSIAVELERK